MDQNIRMVRRDRNQASVVMWDLLNETPEGPLYQYAISDVCRIMRRLDPTRIIVGSSGKDDLCLQGERTTHSHINGQHWYMCHPAKTEEIEKLPGEWNILPSANLVFPYYEGFPQNGDSELAVIPFGKGKLILTTLEILPNLLSDPVADQLLINMIRFATTK